MYCNKRITNGTIIDNMTSTVGGIKFVRAYEYKFPVLSFFETENIKYKTFSFNR